MQDVPQNAGHYMDSFSSSALKVFTSEVDKQQMHLQ